MTKDIYLDNAATSMPKPEEVYRAVEDFMRRLGGTPARGIHPRAMEAGQILADCRSRLARLLGCETGYRMALTCNATDSLNLAIKGFLRRNAHVVVTQLEHNSVWRPLARLRAERGVRWTVVKARKDGTIDPAAVRRAIRPATRLVAVTHASNVLGTRVDVEGIVEVSHDRGVPVLVDAAQTAGVVPINAAADGIDILAFTGHKSLLGPPGTGGLGFRGDLEILPLKEGGTGTYSDKPVQPDDFPDRYETGSPNMYGFAGLGAGVQFVEKRGVPNVGRHKSELAALAREELRRIRTVTLYGSDNPELSVGILSFNIGGLDPNDAAKLLWERGRIMVRTGLHCAPYVHRLIGTEGRGTVRVGVGYANTKDHIETLARTVRDIVERPPRRGKAKRAGRKKALAR